MLVFHILRQKRADLYSLSRVSKALHLLLVATELLGIMLYASKNVVYRKPFIISCDFEWLQPA